MHYHMHANKLDTIITIEAETRDVCGRWINATFTVCSTFKVALLRVPVSSAASTSNKERQWSLPVITKSGLRDVMRAMFCFRVWNEQYDLQPGVGRSLYEDATLEPFSFKGGGPQSRLRVHAGPRGGACPPKVSTPSAMPMQADIGSFAL